MCTPERIIHKRGVHIMKKLYGLLGFAGFIFIVSAAGGADTAPIGVSVAFMLMGIAMMVTSELLVGLHGLYLLGGGLGPKERKVI